MKKTAITLACSAAFIAAAATHGKAQGGAPAAPASLVAEVQAQFTSASNNIVRSAEQFPEDKYAWTPTVPAQPDNATLRSWAQLVAHMTDDANNNCWTLAGLSAAPASVERGTPPPNQKTKADLVAGIKSAMETCTKAFAAVTPANMMEPAGGRGNVSKLGRLITYVAHANEHYGNMVTYMRLAGMVPPSSAGRGPRGGGAPGGGRQ
jgi:uncharacterized damage-inducible protein DinB